jgi:hypothetical protein
MENFDILQAYKAARTAGVNVNDPEAFENFVKTFKKDVITGTRPVDGWLYENGPFSLVEDEPVSAVIKGGSALAQWLPARLVDYRYPHVSHLEWIAPDGFDGSETYRDYLRDVEIADCDYGPTSDWSGFEYHMEGAEWSFQSPVLKDKDFGMKDYEESPVYQVRGGQAGMPLTNDADWAVARSLILMEQHMSYLLVYGDITNSVMEFDGLDTIISNGYVASKVVGPGVPHWPNPLIVNAAAVTTAAGILELIRGMVRKLRNRALSRNWSLAVNDMAILLPAAMWPYIADSCASGSHVAFDATEFTGQMTYGDFLSERSRITQGGLGFGFIDVDGMAVPVIPDGNLGRNTTIDPGGDNEAEGVTGDIMILTRRINGMTILEQQYMDWSQFVTPDNGHQDTFALMNGLMKGGWKLENNACFQYYLKAGGRLTSLFQPMQARINNVSLTTILENENEGGMFWSPDFYAYDGAQGGGAVSLLTPL